MAFKLSIHVVANLTKPIVLSLNKIFFIEITELFC